MDWGLIAEDLRKAAKLYKLFEDGADAAQEMVNAEHRAANLKEEIRGLEARVQDLHGQVTHGQATVTQLHQDADQITQAMAPKRAELTELQGQYTRLMATSKDVSGRIAADRELAVAQVAEAARQQAGMEADYHRVANEVTRLTAIRDELKASLARI